MPITFGEKILLYAGDGELFHIDLPETEDDVCKPKIKEPAYHPPAEQSNEAAAMLGFLSLDTEIGTLNLESITEEPVKKKKQKEKASKKVKKKETAATDDTAFISDCIASVVKGGNLHKKTLHSLEDLFRLQGNRKIFVEQLKSTADIDKAVVLEHDSFKQFTKICKSFLSKAESAYDFAAIWKFVQLMECFSSERDTQRKFMYESLQGLSVWSYKEFWEATVDICAVNQNMGADDALFSKLAKITCYMQRVGMPPAEITKFLKQHGDSLPENLQNDLQRLISQMQHIQDKHVQSQVKSPRLKGRKAKAERSPVSPRLSAPQEDQNLKISPRYPMSSSNQPKELVFEVKETLTGHKKKGGVSCMHVRYPKIVSGTITGDVMLYDLEAQSYSAINLRSHKKRISSICMDDDTLVTGSHDNVSTLKHYIP